MVNLNKYLLGCTAIFALVIVTCSAPKKNTSNKSNHHAPARKILTGKLTAEQIYKQIPAYKAGSEQYQPDEATIEQLAIFSKTINIDVFLGTWCPDCQRQVPRFLKIMEQADNSNFRYLLYGLDRTKRDAEGLAEKNQIEFVPTFIVFHNQKEIGRIVENPMVSLEQDLLEILQSIGK